MSKKFKVRGRNNTIFYNDKKYSSGPVYDCEVEGVSADAHPAFEYVDGPSDSPKKPEPKPEVSLDLDGDGDVDADDASIASRVLNAVKRKKSRGKKK